MSRKRVILSATQKRELCETKEKNPNLSNISLAQQYRVGKSTITDILKEKERWLSITESQGSIKKFRGPKWPQLENALSLWVDNALNTKQDIDEDFHQSDGWLTGFKKRYGLCQYKKQGEAASAPSAESIEHDRLALQQILDGIVEKLDDYTIYDALQNAAEAWSMVSSQTISNCWKKTGILPPNNEIEEIPEDYDSVISDSILDREIEELDMLIAQLPKSNLNAYEYLHIEDEMPEGGLTDREIINTILNADNEEELLIDEDESLPVLEKVSLAEADDAANKIMRFLYEQGPEFGEVNNELKVLRGLHKRIKLLIVENLKQADIHNYFHNNTEQ
ncbi:14791_t:CDS:2 [Rhizophagus irregularis]|nr:14791_t:CDS:2 [Rhizophagus irregularis]